MQVCFLTALQEKYRNEESFMLHEELHLLNKPCWYTCTNYLRFKAMQFYWILVSNYLYVRSWKGDKIVLGPCYEHEVRFSSLLLTDGGPRLLVSSDNFFSVRLSTSFCCSKLSRYCNDFFSVSDLNNNVFLEWNIMIL